MFTYVLCLLALYGIRMGQSQSKECHNCNVKMYSQCLFTYSDSVICADDTYRCGKIQIISGTSLFFSKYGCFSPENCNKTQVPLSAVLRPLSYNSTCCETNFCNGGFSARAPPLLILGAVSTVALYVIS